MNTLRLLIIIAGLVASGCTTRVPGVPNLAQVTNTVWRGGQPDAAGWKQLRELGVTQVVKLNSGYDCGAYFFGIQKVRRFPINFWAQLSGPSPTVVEGAVQVLQSSKEKIFVHCAHGQDRTGLVVACFLRDSGWTSDAARSDMMARGFHRSLVGLDRYWLSRK